MSAHPLIYTRRSRIGYLCDVLLTVCGWLFFIFMFAVGILNVLNGELRGPQGLLALPLTHTLLAYTVLALINAVILIGWVLYNYRRFSGKERRQPTRALSEQHLQSSFNLSQSLFDRAREAQMMMIAHEEDSAISGISIVPADAPPAPIPVPTPGPLPVAAPAQEHFIPAMPTPPKALEDPSPRWGLPPQPLPTMLYNNLRFRIGADYTLSPLPVGNPA